MSMTDAHYQNIVEQEQLRLWFPEHEPRAHDPLYHIFAQVKKRLRAEDVPCWRCGVHYADLNDKRLGPTSEKNPLAAMQLEAHHFDVEFSLQKGIDIERWWEASHQQKKSWFVQNYTDVDGFLAAHPDLDPSNHTEVFMQWVESEGNLMQLCDVCHRSKSQGIHHINYPDWRPLAVWRRDLPAHVSEINSA